MRLTCPRSTPVHVGRQSCLFGAICQNLGLGGRGLAQNRNRGDWGNGSRSWRRGTVPYGQGEQRSPEGPTERDLTNGCVREGGATGGDSGAEVNANSSQYAVIRPQTSARIAGCRVRSVPFLEDSGITARLEEHTMSRCYCGNAPGPESASPNLLIG